MADEIQDEEKTKTYKQYVAAIIANIIGLCYGCAIGWISPFLGKLTDENQTILTSPLTPVQVSLVASLICVGGLISTPIFGYISDKYGRKTALLASIVPLLLCWILKISWLAPEGICMARALAGFGGTAAFLVVSNYCVEIASTSTRGILGSLTIFSINGGIVLMYIIGAFLNYITAVSIMIVLSITSILIFFIPETPVYLVKHKKYEEAEKSISWLNSETPDSTTVQKILKKLKHESSISSSSDAESDQNKLEDSSALKFLLNSAPTKKAFSVCFLLLFIQCLSGVFPILTFASDIFEESKSNLSPNTSSIIIGIIQLLGSITASTLIERTGRKILLITSSAIISFSTIVLGIYFLLSEEKYDLSGFGVIPVIALSLVVFAYSVGLGPIPFILPSEIIAIQSRGLASTVLIISFWLSTFILTQVFLPMINVLHIYGVFWFFALFSFSGVLVTIFLLPETKGKSFETIFEYYGGKKTEDSLISDDKDKEYVQLDL